MKITPVEFADLIEKYVRAIEYNKAQITELTNKLMQIEMKAKTSPFTAQLLFNLFVLIDNDSDIRADKYRATMTDVKRELLYLGYFKDQPKET